MATLTPFQLRFGRWYKRDDLHRGGGGTNGAKLRACEHLIKGMAASGVRIVVTAASVLSPQHAIVANVAAGLGMRSIHLVGATNDVAMQRHPSIRSALAAGAEFRHIGCAYNASLQPAAARLAAELPDAAVLHYGITTAPGAPAADVRAFSVLGGHQVANLPAEVETLVIPFGSGNTASGILTGLDVYGRHDLAVKLVGIGPPRLEWMLRRLGSIGVAPPPDLELMDLHGSGYARYSDRMPETRDGIVLHPTYEGKVVRYLDTARPPWWERDGRTCLWIIGAAVGS